jgi:hypothetical protein
MKNLIFFLIISLPVSLFAQYDGIVGTAGCKAIHCDDARFVEWASDCELTRGYQNIAQQALGFVTYGSASNAIGKASDIATDAVSLGDGGEAVLTFQTPIVNGTGADFAVFENGLNDYFLELAFVEVSSDGVHYFRFPAVSNIEIAANLGNHGFPVGSVEKLYNLAGKYRVGWGTPFDLNELPSDENIDVNNIRYVKIVDVIGNIDPDLAPVSFDSNGHIIADPYPTAFPSGGFDLTGVGVIHNQNNTAVKKVEQEEIFVYNDAHELRIINYKLQNGSNLQIFDVTGKLLLSSIFNSQFSINISELPRGIYLIKAGKFTGKFVK